MSIPVDRWARSAESDGDSVAEAGKAIKQVEAKVTVAVEDLKKGLGTLFENLSSAIQTEMAKHPEAREMYTNLYKNVNSGVSEYLKSLNGGAAGANDATAAPTAT